MTLKIELTDPQEHKPSTLRALAHLLNCMAADKGEDLPAAIKAALDEGNDLNPSAPAAPDAPGASATLTPPPPPAALAPDEQLPELDKNGFRWDARIHSSSKNLNADGTWRYLRGGDLDERARVEAEQRGATPPPPPAAAPAADMPPPPPPPPVPEEAPAAPEAGEVTMAMAFKRVSQLEVTVRDEALQMAGLSKMGDFVTGCKTDPELPATLWAAIVALTGEE